MRVPLFELTRQNRRLWPELQGAIKKVIDSGVFIMGDEVRLIENQIAEMIGVSFGIGVANGSDALHLSVQACGIGPGDEVITTPFTFVATAEAIVRHGATPVFADIDLGTYNISPESIAAAVTSRTKAIIVVHLYGNPVDMQPIMDIAEERDLLVIEDAAQAIGAEYNGKMAGSIGKVGCLSFFPTKNLGCFGDGGMILTDCEKLTSRLRILRLHGSDPKYFHAELGCNSRLDTLQAAVLDVKLKYLDEWTQRRRQIASMYSNLLEDLPVVLPKETDRGKHVYHQYTIRTAYRDELRSYLEANGIETGLYYPLALHMQKVFSYLGYEKGDFANSELASREVLSLPMFPEIKDREVEYVCDKIREFFTNPSTGRKSAVSTTVRQVL